MNIKYKLIQEYVTNPELLLVKKLIQEDYSKLCFDDDFRKSAFSYIGSLEILLCKLSPIIIYLENIPIGIIIYQKTVKSKEYSIGISILNEYQQLGIGKQSILEALKILFEKRNAAAILARIQPDNIKSINLFTGLGFIPTNRIYSDNRVELSYPKSMYNKNK